MKEQLSSQGIEPERIAAIERQLANPEDFDGYISKYVLNGKKSSGWQGLMNRLSDIEIGSFGEQLPGSFMNKDLFLQGGTIALQTGKGAIRLGLAENQDIGFAKDAGFTHSNLETVRLLP